MHTVSTALLIQAHSMSLHSYSHRAANTESQGDHGVGKGVIYVVHMTAGNWRKLKNLNSSKASSTYAQAAARLGAHT